MSRGGRLGTIAAAAVLGTAGGYWGWADAAVVWLWQFIASALFVLDFSGAISIKWEGRAGIRRAWARRPKAGELAPDELAAVVNRAVRKAYAERDPAP